MPNVKPPWFVWTSLASVTCILVGGYWDISWHMSIGRDSFWTPAHIAIQLGGLIGGGAGTVLILRTTFARGAALRDASIRVWGFRGPLGAFLAVWGSATMLLSAPFDNWWHGAYGLDVKILSPPHAVLALGILTVAAGGVLQIVAALNRAPPDARRWIEAALLVVGGEVVTLGMISILELTFRSNLHRAEAYRAISIVVPLLALSIVRASRHRWGATIVASTYVGFMAAMVWLFPLFAAEAKLGPVYQEITHFIPLQFPILIVAPAIAWDVVLPRIDRWPRHQRAIVAGALFLVVLVAVQWPFASFLLSEHARNWFFGGHYFPYFAHPDWYDTRFLFIPEPDLARGLLQACVAAIASSYVGLLIGDALRKARR
jgi:hypothetical protein